MNFEGKDYHTGQSPYPGPMVVAPQNNQVTNPGLFDLDPKKMIAYAADMAAVLKEIIDKQKLFTDIKGKKHVKVEGWTTLGAMLGILPREVEVKEYPNGSYEAKIELYSLKSGQVVGQASSICGIDETRWGHADKYARRSMSITRAVGKAYRLGFSWIMVLAGFDATPAEEIPPKQTKDNNDKKDAEQDSDNQTNRSQEAVYDPNDPKMNKWVQDGIIAAKVPQVFWDDVHNAMVGKPASELKNILKEFK